MSEVKEKNTIVKDAIILCVITLVAGLLLGFVYEITKEPIAKAEQTAKEKAYATIYNKADTFEKSDKINELVEKSKDLLKDQSFVAADQTYSFDGITIDEAVVAKSGKDIMGYIVMVTTPNGYGGNISIALGVGVDGTVAGTQILTINETPGLGMNAKGEFKDQFDGKKVDGFIYTKNGKTAENEIDAITSATITTKAVTEAVNAGLYFVNNIILENNTK